MQYIQKSLGLASLAAALVIASASAWADPPICTITGEPTATNPSCVDSGGAVRGPLGGVFDAPGIYWAARSATITNGSLGAPIDSQNICRYIDNRTNPADPGTGAVFVPFRSYDEWIRFIMAHSDPAKAVYAVPCVRPKNSVPATYADGTPAKRSGDAIVNPLDQVYVDVPCYGYPTIADHPLTVPPYVCGPISVTVPCQRDDCNAYGNCNDTRWTETFTIKCTAVLDATQTGPQYDGGKWDCRVVAHSSPPPFNPPSTGGDWGGGGDAGGGGGGDGDGGGGGGGGG